MTKQIRLFAVIATLALNLATPRAQAAMSPLSVNVAPPVQFPADDFTVTGLRLSLGFGNHRDMYGIDIGVLGNITQQNFSGLALSGLFNMTKGETRVLGLQAAGLTNLNYGKTRVVGLQAALGANYLTAESSVVGLQLAAVNLADHTKIYGVQAGIYNRANTVNGFQIGLVNVTNSLRGLQIGLINFHHQGIFSVCPILNVGF